MVRKIVFLNIVVFVFLITGCGGEESSSASSSKGGSVVKTGFSPSQPTSSDVITLKITAIAEETPNYKWVVNGVPVSVSGNKLSPEHFSKNDTVFCSILIGGEEKKKIGPIIIKNSPPSISSIELSPSDPRHGTDIYVNADLEDLDGDRGELLVRWFINDEEVADAGDVLSGSKIKAADKVYAFVTPFDGVDEGLPRNSGWVVIQNSPPDIVFSPPSVQGKAIDHEIKVKDNDGDKVDLSLEEGPLGMKIENNRLTWEIPEVESDTSFMVKIKARDERGGVSSISFPFNVRRTEMR
jgi:hypothetical protein